MKRRSKLDDNLEFEFLTAKDVKIQGSKTDVFETFIEYNGNRYEFWGETENEPDAWRVLTQSKHLNKKHEYITIKKRSRYFIYYREEK